MTTTAAATVVNPFAHSNPMSNGTNAGQAPGTASMVSANDFLMLLVTEMKNQDPTAQTDPNEYINQLVQVNSLEQLIEINENLSSALGANADATGARTGAAHATGTLNSARGVFVEVGQNTTRGVTDPMPVSANPVSAFAGNLGIFKPIPATQRIAQALSGRG